MAEGGCQIDWIQSYSINRHTITALACLSPPSIHPSIHPVQWLWTSSWINNCSLAVSWGSLLWIPIRYYIRTASHSGSQVTHLMHGIVVKLNLRYTQPFSGSPMGAQLTSRRRRLEAVVEWTPRRRDEWAIQMKGSRHRPTTLEGSAAMRLRSIRLSEETEEKDPLQREEEREPVAFNKCARCKGSTNWIESQLIWNSFPFINPGGSVVHLNVVPHLEFNFLLESINCGNGTGMEERRDSIGSDCNLLFRGTFFCEQEKRLELEVTALVCLVFLLLVEEVSNFSQSVRHSEHRFECMLQQRMCHGNERIKCCRWTVSII